MAMITKTDWLAVNLLPSQKTPTTNVAHCAVCSPLRFQHAVDRTGIDGRRPRLVQAGSEAVARRFTGDSTTRTARRQPKPRQPRERWVPRPLRSNSPLTPMYLLMPRRGTTLER